MSDPSATSIGLGLIGFGGSVTEGAKQLVYSPQLQTTTSTTSNYSPQLSLQYTAPVTNIQSPNAISSPNYANTQSSNPALTTTQTPTQTSSPTLTAPTTTASGMSSITLILLGAVGLGAVYFLTKGKKK